MKAVRFIRFVLRLFYQDDIPNAKADEQWAEGGELIAALQEWVIYVRVIWALARCLAPQWLRVKALTVSGYYRHCCYPGSRLMSLSCWLRHPISKTERAEAEFSAGWHWPDPDEMPAVIG